MIGYCFELRRRHRHLSQTRVATSLHISRTTVARYEHGNLTYARNGQKEKLDALNKQWTLEDYESR